MTVEYAVTNGGDDAIKKWIAGQMKGKTCAVVLVGSNTANRKWINYEIVKAWDDGLGVVGIRIHGLKNFEGQTSTQGANPFDYIGYPQHLICALWIPGLKSSELI